MRAGMTQNAPISAENSSKEGKKNAASPKISNPATKVGVDPLAGMMPCVNESCEAGAVQPLTPPDP